MAEFVQLGKSDVHVFPVALVQMQSEDIIYIPI